MKYTSDPVIEWISAHQEELNTKYAGQYIAVHAAKGVVAYSDSYQGLVDRLSNCNFEFKNEIVIDKVAPVEEQVALNRGRIEGLKEALEIAMLAIGQLAGDCSSDTGSVKASTLLRSVQQDVKDAIDKRTQELKKVGVCYRIRARYWKGCR